MVNLNPSDTKSGKPGALRRGAALRAAPASLPAPTRAAPSVSRQFDSFDFVDFSFQVSRISVFLRKQTYVLGSASCFYSYYPV